MSAEADSPFRDRDAIDDDTAETILRDGTIEVLGQMPWSSNTTLLCDVEYRDDIVQAVYKPHRGERPLWDFPSGLYRREVACYELSRTLGWDLVPPTVLVDGPVGPGSLQLFIPCNFEEHYLTLHDQPRHLDAFRRLAAFDMVANSTDRKSGHVLLGKDGHIWAIDNGLSFHVEFKLRTVLWDFAGDPLPAEVRDDLRALVETGLGDRFDDLLDDEEVDAAVRRARVLVDDGRFPIDTTGRRWPWPLV